MLPKGPSIYDVRTDGGGAESDSGERMWPGEGGPAPCGRPHRKLKLESTDVILLFFSCKEVGVFLTRISSLDGIKSGNFSAI